ncbi:LuxR C-terminal-related transcriptional regulator [Amycolatopsis sp. NPDC049253]|jgi:DNA-binding NarL/FixJ family response regulator|uniref:helix-turn-helix transcriptional regulator n=1 Tax=Amycolatopsis sp. NPDC049253 TaxID=3155274 RepID=UPI003419770F
MNQTLRTGTVRTLLSVSDALTRACLESYFDGQPEVAVVDRTRPMGAEVSLVVTDRFTPRTRDILERVAATLDIPSVLVIGRLDDLPITELAHHRVVTILDKTTSRSEAVTQAVVDAAGAHPADPVERLSTQVRRLTHAAARQNRLDRRETDILRFLADGLSAGEVASQLGYSERTVKNIISKMTVRLELRNRAHAVAYAIREGLI